MESLRQIQERAIELPEDERAALASALLRSLGPPQYDVTDAEVEQRRKDLSDGTAQEISHEEFVARIKRPFTK